VFLRSKSYCEPVRYDLRWRRGSWRVNGDYDGAIVWRARAEGVVGQEILRAEFAVQCRSKMPNLLGRVG